MLFARIRSAFAEFLLLFFEMSAVEVDRSVREDGVRNVKLYKYMGNEPPVVETLEDLIRELHAIFESDSVNIELVSYLMRSYKSKPSEWKKYAKFDRYR